MKYRVTTSGTEIAVIRHNLTENEAYKVVQDACILYSGKRIPDILWDRMIDLVGYETGWSPIKGVTIYGDTLGA